MSTVLSPDVEGVASPWAGCGGGGGAADLPKKSPNTMISFDGEGEGGRDLLLCVMVRALG